MKRILELYQRSVQKNGLLRHSAATSVHTILGDQCIFKIGVLKNHHLG